MLCVWFLVLLIGEVIVKLIGVLLLFLSCMVVDCLMMMFLSFLLNRVMVSELVLEKYYLLVRFSWLDLMGLSSGLLLVLLVRLMLLMMMVLLGRVCFWVFSDRVV